MSAAAAILQTFAELTATRRPLKVDVAADDQPFAWLGTAESLFARERGPAPSRVVLEETPSLRRLATLDALHRHERLLREGWIFLAGTIEVDGARRDLLLPLVSRPVRLTRRIGGLVLSSAGDRELLPLVPAGPTRNALESVEEMGEVALAPRPLLPAAPAGFPPRHATMPMIPLDATPDEVAQLGWLNEWIRAVADAAGLHVDVVLAPGTLPLRHRGGDELVAIVGSGLYVARDLAAIDLSSTLGNWSGIVGIEDTAFASIYGIRPTQPVGATRRDPVRSVLPLTARQREVVVRSRAEDVVVVSGPPGNGKSHTVVATAMDAVDRGLTVLVATQTDHAADVLADMLRRHPGPDPVLFGDAERRDAIASQLGGGLGVPLPASELERRAFGVDQLEQRVRWIEQSIRDLLATEGQAEELATYEPQVPQLLESVPGAFAPHADIERYLELARTASSNAQRGDARSAVRGVEELRELLGTTAACDLTTITRALVVARTRHASVSLVARGGTTIESTWDEPARADSELALGVGSLVADRMHAERCLNPQSRAAVAALATTLRANRAWRRVHLEALDGSSLLQALPLWVGTLRDIDDLLPPTPALFDLVVLDEASQIDQPNAALALLRGDRAVVVGDPQQLRHVTQVDDLDMATAIDERNLGFLAGRVDLHNSAFDVAAGSTAVTWLDEHFRSAPHLIQFSAEHFYPDDFHLMTRHPRNEDVDVIDTVRVQGTRGADGVNAVEVAEVRRLVEGFIAQGVTNIGVVSPFRAQADALERMLLDDLPPGQVADLDVRVGTVHELQGNERDIVIVSLALGPDDDPQARALLDDPNLFNVMVTRARDLLVVVTSVGDGVGGLLGEYLEYAEHPPRPPAPSPARHPWIAAVADELDRLGVPARPHYPVGQWAVDLCIGEGERAMAVECVVHPAGAAVHIERHRFLQRAGWRITDAFPTRWDGDPVSAAVALSTELRRDPRR